MAKKSLGQVSKTMHNEWGDIIDHVLTQTLNEQKWQQFTLEIFQRQYTTLQTMHNEEDLTLVTCVLPKQIVFQKYFKTRDNLCQTMHMSTEQDLGGICKHMYPRSTFGPRPSSWGLQSFSLLSRYFGIFSAQTRYKPHFAIYFFSVDCTQCYWSDKVLR